MMFANKQMEESGLWNANILHTNPQRAQNFYQSSSSVFNVELSRFDEFHRRVYILSNWGEKRKKLCKALRSVVACEPASVWRVAWSEIQNTSSGLISRRHKTRLGFISSCCCALLARKIPFSQQKWLATSCKLTMRHISLQVNSY